MRAPAHVQAIVVTPAMGDLPKEARAGARFGPEVLDQLEVAATEMVNRIAAGLDIIAAATAVTSRGALAA